MDNSTKDNNKFLASLFCPECGMATMLHYPGNGFRNEGMEMERDPEMMKCNFCGYTTWSDNERE